MKKLLLSLIIITSLYSHADSKSVLFIGNSYTYYNNMPNLLKQIALSAGDTLDVVSHTPGGRRISQHANDPQVYDLIRSRPWDYVVVQCQSQEPSFSDGQVATDVFPYAKQICDSIRSNSTCSIPLFYMTWGRKNGDSRNCPFFPPLCTYEGMDSILHSNYMKMGEQNDSEVAPVGAVWRELRTSSKSIDLYHSDESHPSFMGSMAIAYTFYTSIFRKSPYVASFIGAASQEDIDSIQNAVDKVLFQNIEQFYIGSSDPDATFTYSNENCEFTFKSEIPYDSEVWIIGDDTISDVSDPVYLFKNEGAYVVKRAVSECGRTDTFEIKIRCGVNSIHQKKESTPKIYPNPSHGSFQVSKGWYVKSATNISGQEVEVRRETNRYSVSDRNQALFILLENAKGMQAIKKIGLK
ncbi:MAG: hypothetical protein ACPGYY_08190 [Bacteroidia bacterium]